jgi:hypothetical protein
VTTSGARFEARSDERRSTFLRSQTSDIGLDVIAMIGAMFSCMTRFVACRRGRYPIGSWSERAEQAAYSQGMQARTAE